MIRTSILLLLYFQCFGCLFIEGGNKILINALRKPNLSNSYITINSSQELTHSISLKNIHNLTVVGSENTLCTCRGENVGISIEDASNITFINLIFKNCGTKFNSTASPPHDNKMAPYITTALYFNQTINISFRSVKIINSTGYGIVMYDCGGSLNFQHLYVTDGKLAPYLNSSNISIAGYSSGGGIYFEYTRNGRSKFIQNNSINFTDCEFGRNQGENKLFSQYNAGKHIPFGHGAGLCIIFLGKAINNIITIINMNVTRNSALWGDGLYISFSDIARSNVIVYTDGSIKLNHVLFVGGGILVNTSGKNDEQRNTVSFFNVTFEENTAQQGGGLGLHYIDEEPVILTLYEIKFTNCSFHRNIAVLGAALYLHSSFILFQNKNITHNYILKTEFENGKSSLNVPHGALYAFNVILEFIGRNYIINNHNTAFIIIHTWIRIYGGLIFEGNEGTDGGALRIYQHSKVFLYSKTSLFFHNNYASKGGAIYVKVPEPILRLDLLAVRKCFFVNAKFGGKVEFVNNTAKNNNGNAIFATTIFYCHEKGKYNSSHTLSGWKNFNFSSNPAPAIVTDPVRVEIIESQWSNIYPGQLFSPTIQLYDEKDNSVSSTIDIEIEEDIVRISGNRKRFFVSNENIELSLLTTRHYEPFNVVIKSIATNVLPKRIENRMFEQCLFAYTFERFLKKCICDVGKNQNRGIELCQGNKICLFKNMWSKPNSTAGYSDNEIVVPCPDNYCQLCEQRNCLYRPNHQCANDRVQSSLLCSQCKDGTSVTLGGQTCKKCSNNLLIVVCVGILIGTLLLLMLILLSNIDIYSNYLNSVVFFYQSAHLLGTPTQEYDKYMKVITGLFNLNCVDGYVSFCFYNGMNDMSKMFIRYVVPIAMLMWLFLIIWFSDSKRCTNLYFNKHKCFNAVAFIMMVAYNDITRVTFSLMHPVTLDSDDSPRLYIYAAVKMYHGWHLPVFIIAILMFILVVVLFPLILIFSDTFMRYGYFCKFKPVIDNLSKCFKENFVNQTFSAFYFICRLFMLTIYIFYPRGQSQYTILCVICICILLVFSINQPYKDDIGKISLLQVNMFDILVLTNLAALAILNNGRRELFFNDVMNDLLYKFIQFLMWPPLVVPLTCLCIWITDVLRFCFNYYKNHEVKSSERLLLINRLTEIETSC